MILSNYVYIQQTIKCSICDRMIATDALPCATCQSLSLQKITKSSNQLATFINFYPARQEKGLKPECEKQQDELMGKDAFPYLNAVCSEALRICPPVLLGWLTLRTIHCSEILFQISDRQFNNHTSIQQRHIFKLIIVFHQAQFSNTRG